MNKLDYWFLDLAIGAPTSFSLIIPYERNGIIDAHRTPVNLTINQIIESMHRLFQEGFLSTIIQADLNSSNTLLTKSFTPSYREIKLALEPENNSYAEDDLYQEFRDKELLYFLTKKGGEVWESVSKPKWNHFFRRGTYEWEFIPESIRNTHSLSNNNTLWCTDRDIGEQVIKVEHLLDYYEYVPYPIMDTEKWEKITPWHPTYWKTLSSGYVVNYQVEYRKIDNAAKDLNESQDLVNQKRNAATWYNDIASWYSNYYESL